MSSRLGWERRQDLHDTLNALRDIVVPGSYEVVLSDLNENLKATTLRVERVTKEHPSGDREVELTYLWMKMDDGTEQPVKSVAAQIWTLRVILERGEKVA